VLIIEYRSNSSHGALFENTECHSILYSLFIFPDKRYKFTTNNITLRPLDRLCFGIVNFIIYNLFYNKILNVNTRQKANLILTY